ncbi:zinc finger protein 3-like [Hyperolius riggenbachi]|uniref:zinc finger protein 3-like n=1 Tax=Hyperolius riggenbachi TaxID=752182 RepID=UPI0035A3789E
MEKDRSRTNKKILDLTLEIIYLLTGEDYTIVKTTSDNHATPISQPCVSKKRSRRRSPAMELPPHFLISERKNDNKILEVINKIIELLHREEEDLEGNKDLRKDVLMENQPPIISLDGSSKRNPAEGCTGPPYSHDFTQGELKISQDSQDENLIIKVEVKEEAEETYAWGEEPCKDETPPEISTDGRYNKRKPERGLCSETQNEDIAADCSEENPITATLHPVTLSSDLPSDPATQGEAVPDHSSSVTHHAARRGNETFMCSECGKCFTVRCKLISHQKTHEGEKPYSCSECGKSFSLRSSLIKHNAMHTGERPYSCSECGKCFSYKNSLIAHQMTHTGEKPYSCSECGKCFSLRSNLISHQMIHTGEKPYSCLDCGKCFSRRENLVIHRKTHTGEKPYSCTECGKSFAVRSNRDRHERTHTREKRFSCSECGKLFAEKSYLVIHLRTHGGQPATASGHGV